jgi:hypothetical protein
VVIMAYLGLNNLPQYNPQNSPLALGVGMYQNMQQFPLLQQQRQLQNQQTQIANQYAPQVNQANIALTQAQANSPQMNPQGNYQNLYQAWMNSKDPYEKAGLGALLNKSVAANPNYMGMPAQMATGPFGTNPNSYGGQQQTQPTVQNSPQGMPPPMQSPPNPGIPYQGQNIGGITSQNPQGGMYSNQWQPGMLPPPVNPNQSPVGSAYNFMTASRAPKQQVLNNGPTSTVLSAPTGDSQTLGQTRSVGAAELNYLAPLIANAPYQGLGGDLSALYDLGKYGYNYLTGGDNSALGDRIVSGASATSLAPEYGAIQARTSTGKTPGIELVDKFGNHMIPSPLSSEIIKLLPPGLQSKLIQNNANISGNVEQIANQNLASGFPTQVNSNQVAYQGGNPTPPMQKPVILPPGMQGQQASPSLPPMPQFQSRDELRSWFKNLSPQQKLAYAPQLGGK